MKDIIKNIKTIIALIVGSALLFTACLDDLDQFPPNDDKVDDLLTEEGSLALLSKIYTGFSTSGLKGPNEWDDLRAPDGDQGSLVFLRGLITMQEYTTDEAIWNWADEGIKELVYTNWDYTTKYAYSFYQRCMLNIRYCKEFLTLYPENSEIPNIKQLRDEAKVLRAISYYYLIDAYGNATFVWEGEDGDNGEVSFIPSPMDLKDGKNGRKLLFERVVKDLKEIEIAGNLPEVPTMTTYGRITKPVVWTLLSKLYLNGEVYTGGTPYYKEAAEYAKKVIDSGYFGLEDNYENLFCGENYLTAMSGKNEFIFVIPFDNDNLKSYGSTVVMTVGAYGGALNPNYFGVDQSWTCLKPKETLVDKFEGSYTRVGRFKNNLKRDKRFLFFDIKEYTDIPAKEEDYPEGTSANWPFLKDQNGNDSIIYNVEARRSVNTKMEDWDAGFLCYKFTNLGWDGKRVTSTTFPNTDFPLYRLADVYLIYIECAVRDAEGTDKTEAFGYFNDIRERAGLSKISNVLMNRYMTLDNILDERARELYWEGQRRTDLIRFGKFTKGYAWPYKGGVVEGEPNIDDKFNLFPFSSTDLTSNPNLVQNPGYQSY